MEPASIDLYHVYVVGETVKLVGVAVSVTGLPLVTILEEAVRLIEGNETYVNVAVKGLPELPILKALSI